MRTLYLSPHSTLSATARDLSSAKRPPCRDALSLNRRRSCPLSSPLPPVPASGLAARSSSRVRTPSTSVNGNTHIPVAGPLPPSGASAGIPRAGPADGDPKRFLSASLGEDASSSAIPLVGGPQYPAPQLAFRAPSLGPRLGSTRWLVVHMHHPPHGLFGRPCRLSPSSTWPRALELSCAPSKGFSGDPNSAPNAQTLAPNKSGHETRGDAPAAPQRYKTHGPTQSPRFHAGPWRNIFQEQAGARQLRPIAN